MQTLRLNEGTFIPILGFGTWKLNEKSCQKAVLDALEIGFRHIDTADTYSNHEDIAVAIKKSGLKRNDLFITTKVWWSMLTRKEVLESGERFLDELETDYLDLLLIHWPNREVPIQETLGAMNELKEKGVIKALGVSNFTIRQLNETLKTGFEVTNNQIEFHPSFNQKKIKDYCDKKGVIVTAYSPNGQGQDLQIPTIKKIAKKYGALEPQVILAWIRQKQIVAIPKSANPKHARENFESLKLSLTKEDLTEIDSLNKNNRLVNFQFSKV